MYCLYEKTILMTDEKNLISSHQCLFTDDNIGRVRC
jgi:hypothetical protein